MKIQERKGVLDPRLGGPDAVRPDGGSSSGSPAPGSGDQVTVSEAARELARLRAEVGDLGAVRQDRVEGLAAVMAKGQYSADFDDVAEKILRELLGEVLA